ncbi:ribonuclease H-like domain-containing protein, partial [Tanacetum coccineum]
EEEFQEDATIVLPVGMSNTAIEFKDGEFQWDLCSPRPALSNIQMKVERGMRVPVCGSVGWSVGSGKSSFLCSILGEILKVSCGDPDPVTRISKLDISDPLHLHPNDSTALTVVSIKLKRTKNYQVWSCAMMLDLEGKNKIGFIDGSCKRSNTDEVLGKQWDRNGSSIADYYHKLNALWKQYDAMIELPKCVCNASEGFKKHNQLLKLMQFLMGLDDSYMQIRSSILSREVLPYVRSAYATISSEESHRVRSNQNFSVGPSRPNNLNNNRQEKSCKNIKKQNVSNNNSVEKSSSSGFTDKQIATLISLIKDNKAGKNVKANMAGANQHMTYTDKELDNVLDISHLRIKVGHPNGTEAYISKIRNLRLSNGLTLYDVMVIPEYCVTLISVHKLAKENKVIVAFDENRCYFLNQDLNLKNVLGIGDQCEGLYYYNNQGIKSNNSTLRYQCLLSQHDWHCRLGHPAEHVLNVLKESLQIDKKDNIGYCEVCQRAKQTKEPFSLSDYTYKSLGDLVHLDLWGPYRVTRRMIHDQSGQGEGPTLFVESQHTPIASPSTSQPTTSQPTSSQEQPSQAPHLTESTTSSPPLYETTIPQPPPPMPYDSPLLGGHTPGSDEGSKKLNELADLCTKLSTKVTSLEEDLKKTKKLYGKAITKLVKKVKHLEY